VILERYYIKSVFGFHILMTRMTTLTTMTKMKMMMMTMTTTAATHNMSSTLISFIHNVFFGCRFVGSVSSLNLCSPTWMAEHLTLPSDAEKMYGS